MIDALEVSHGFKIFGPQEEEDCVQRLLHARFGQKHLKKNNKTVVVCKCFGGKCLFSSSANQ